MSVSDPGSHMKLQSRWWRRLRSAEGLTDAGGLPSPECFLTVDEASPLYWSLAACLSSRSDGPLHRTA